MRGGGYGVIIRPLVNFAVGMFIFLSGYLTKENENGVYRDIIYRRIKKIIVPYEYSCAVTPQVRQTGNRLSGLAGTAYASLLA